MTKIFAGVIAHTPSEGDFKWHVYLNVSLNRWQPSGIPTNYTPLSSLNPKVESGKRPEAYAA
jgi:hypothetical protein